MFFKMKRKRSQAPRSSMESAKDGPSGYEGREHVSYKNPGFTREKIQYPQDEPHMKSHVTRNEEHEAEDDYHMDVPDQSPKNLPKKIKRAKMLMDGPQGPKPLLGNLTENVSKKGMKDEDGEEDYGPHDMQKDEGESSSKEHRKKLAVAVIKRKMKKY
jgi:hypothetical protein